MSKQHQVSCKEICNGNLQMLNETFGDKTLSRSHVFEWNKGFLVGRDCVKKDERVWRPRIAPTYINSKQTTVPPAHHWYDTKRPGGSLFLQCSRKEQNILTRFWCGHLRTLTFRDCNKVFPTCVRCSVYQASPEQILDCLGFSKQDLYEDPLILLDFLRVNGIMDLI
ncbi:RNase H domain-containing protein [Trichonephila clavipes]|nr:RNase H domain-containing protein [Trichonephila clavipes]